MFIALFMIVVLSFLGGILVMLIFKKKKITGVQNMKRFNPEDVDRIRINVKNDEADDQGSDNGNEVPFKNLKMRQKGYPKVLKDPKCSFAVRPVYITHEGWRYHKMGCASLKHAKILKEMGACKVCMFDDKD